MNKLIILLLALGFGCQPRVVPAVLFAAATPEAPTSQVAAPTLAPLREHNLAHLLQGRGYSESEGLENLQALNGFFGPAHYRLSLVLLAVRQDSLQPLVYHVRGKSRFKGVTLPFTGKITLTQLLEQPHYSTQEVAIAQQEKWVLPDVDRELYTAVGRFELHEQAGQRGAGVFRGKVALDFGFTENGEPDFAWRTDRWPITHS